MSFESNIANHLKDLEKQRMALVRERFAMLHDCDCEYCEVAGDLSDDYTEEDLDAKDAEIKAVDDTIAKVKLHAKRHKVEVSE